jgi:predicted MFS family arabinose efflux permease
MNKDSIQKFIFIIQIVFIVLLIFLSAFLFLNNEVITFQPWIDSDNFELAWTSSGNNERIVFTQNSQKSVMVLNSNAELIYQLNAKPDNPKSFTLAMFVEFDEENNLYLLDTNFGGALTQNAERILKYSPEGKFIKELYAYRYTNNEFIISKGKISGMSYFDNAVYTVRLENTGFYLERILADGQDSMKRIAYFDYPNAFHDLTYSCINAEKEILVVATKAGSIKQYDFSGNLITEVEASEDNSPWMAASDNNNNLIYTDISSGEIVFIDTSEGEERTVLFTQKDGYPYYQINYVNGTFFAIAETEILIQRKNGEVKYLDSYYYSRSGHRLRVVLFVFCLLDILVFLVLLASFIRFLSKKKFTETFKRILLVGICIAFGAGISSVLIINEMNDRYYENTYTDLENVSRLMASGIDIGVLTSLSSKTQLDSEEYLRLSGYLKARFGQLPFNGKRAYQYIWMERDGIVYSMYDSESALGVLFPFTEYAGSYYQEVYDSKQYVYTSDVTASGSWLFACGPILDQDGNVVALIETGYNMSTVEEQTRAMIVQTTLIVTAAAIAFLLLMIELILIFNAYKRNRTDWSAGAAPPFRPELPRAIIFIMYVAGNLPTALLPMYAANLYQPLFNLPREFVVTLPFTADVVFVSLALLIIPNILKKVGFKQIGIMAAFFYIIGNGLCFIATNTAYLAIAYAFTGFAGGAIILVVNTIIGAQKEVEDVNSGFAHFNAAYLAGMNVGVVFGSILAQFFPYRLVYLFSLIIAIVLFMVFIYSTRSKYIKNIFNIAKEDYQQSPESSVRAESLEAKKFSLLKFILRPAVLVTLVFLLLPYMVSMSFTNYFMPIFGTENGLGESNIGQLILLSGLFAILFGTSLCEYTSRKFSIKLIIFASLLLNAAGIYLFSFHVSVIMLIAVTVLLAIANIFVLTNIQTYYTTLYQNSAVSSMRALSIYSAVENLSMMFGPIFFSYILVSDIAGGMKIFATALIVCLVLFMVFSAIFGKKKQSASKISAGLLSKAAQIKSRLA